MLTRQADRGTVLFLFPAAVLVVFLMAALVVDVAVVQLQGRELQAVADSAANDALAALDVTALRTSGVLALDPAAARAQVQHSVAGGDHPDAVVDAVRLGHDGAGRITVDVDLRLTTDLVMTPSVGGLGTLTLQRTGHATILGSAP